MTKKRYSVFYTIYYLDEYCEEHQIAFGAIEKEKILRNTNSKVIANFVLKDRMSTLIDFYKKENVVEISVYDHMKHKAIARCTYFNNIKRR